MPPGPYPERLVAAEVARRIALGGWGTRQRLADFLGLHPSSISHALSGKYQWNLDMISAVAAFFDAPPGWPLVPWEMAARAYPKGTSQK